MRKIKDSIFPENILQEIGINKVSEIKIDYSRLTDDQVKGLLYVISQIKRRDGMILLCRYEDKMTYKEIGERFCITSERAQQLVSKGLRMLRHPVRYSYIIWGYETYNQMLSEKKKQLAALKREEIVKSGNEIFQTDISVLQLTIRTWNILNRIGIHTVGRLIKILEEDKQGLGIRIGKNSLSEIICKLEELGLLSDC